jgi:hypothetical protein
MENLRTIGKRPSVVLRIVDPASSNRAVQDSVPIYASDDVYASIGVTGADFASWQQRYGMDSLGTTAEGELFIPEYPVLSKVAWTHIDSVTLTSTETMALIEECHRAAAHAVSEAAKQELESISVLARKALDHQAVIRFGHA